MARRYFELTEDMTSPERWVLGDTLDAQGMEVGERLYLNETPIRFDGRLRVPILHPGSPLDFSLSDGGDFPVVTETVASTLTELAPSDVQLYPAEVDSRSAPYFLVNVARLVKCIDDAACTEVRYWKPEHGRPDKVGQYRAVYGMRIDPAKVGDAKVFRPWGYPGALLVAEDVKEALERTGASGLEFREVTGPSPISEEERAYKRKCRELLEPPPAARRAAWKSLGALDELAVAPRAICYEWPGHRQNWGLIHRAEGRTLLVSEGLSDPFISKLEPSVGFGMELALETEPTELPLDAIEQSWPYILLERVSKEVVAHEHVRERAKAGLLALEVAGTDMPASLVSSGGRVGVLLGQESRSLPRLFPTPFGDVRLVTVKALLPAELEYVSKQGAEGLDELARRFARTGEEHVSRARRRVVV
ncbi:suppressor of fused domain protein [Cystobacter fuscus]|uniref:imm11 family protein n=1 Tax=Cystobacter fuscus TaxID=43 RepID=UPI002B2A816A|nr:suppressor of fused domain protein [Cystobacter fuscus]